MKDLTVGKPRKIIIQFAIPILIGNCFNLAYNLADTRIVGSYLGNNALAAVGSISTFADLLTGFVVGLANGFAVITARYFGMNDRDKVNRNFSSSLGLGCIITLLITLASILGLGGIMNWLNIFGEHREISASYISVIIYGMIFAIIYNTLAANLRAIGDAYTPLIFLIFSTVMNVGLDILCVGYLQMGVPGAAIATVVSQAVAAVLCLIYTWKRYEFLRFRLIELIPPKEYVQVLIPSGMSMAMMSCLVSFGTVSLQTAINTFGTNIIVAHTAARKVTSFYMLPFSVFATAMATYCGQNYGAGKIDRIKEGLRDSLLISYCWAIITIIITYTICPYLIVGVTDTKITEVIETACLYLRVDSLLYFLVPTISILRNGLQGMGDHVTPIISSSLELVAKMLFATLLAPAIGYWGIIVAEPSAWCIMVIPLIVSMVKRIRNAEKQRDSQV